MFLSFLPATCQVWRDEMRELGEGRGSVDYEK